MFDYKGDFASLFTSYDGNNLYKIGILNDTRKADRITYKLLESRLKGGEKVTIPLGSKKDTSPVLFIILGVLLSVFMALLINSKRKFREDATRALLRPYNFFADIRDLRIFSGIHTIILMLVISATFSLLLSILLFHWKNNLLADKVILAFNCPNLSKAIGYLAWHPRQAFVILFGFSIGLIFLHTAVLKFGSFFVKTRVLVSNVFYTVVWAFMPITLLLPLELILHRLLAAQIANLYIFGFMLLFIFWLLQRMLKGVYVIFDVRGIYVYAVSFLFLIFVVGGIMAYFQLADSTIYYIINAFKQYQLL
jgi:beta-galactosidase